MEDLLFCEAIQVEIAKTVRTVLGMRNKNPNDWRIAAEALGIHKREIEAWLVKVECSNKGENDGS